MHRGLQRHGRGAGLRHRLRTVRQRRDELVRRPGHDLAVGITAGASFPDNDFGIIRYTNPAVAHPGEVSTGSGDAVDITGSATPVVGASLCHIGRVSGMSCGVITAVNVRSATPRAPSPASSAPTPRPRPATRAVLPSPPAARRSGSSSARAPGPHLPADRGGARRLGADPLLTRHRGSSRGRLSPPVASAHPHPTSVPGRPGSHPGRLHGATPGRGTRRGSEAVRNASALERLRRLGGARRPRHPFACRCRRSRSRSAPTAGSVQRAASGPAMTRSRT